MLGSALVPELRKLSSAPIAATASVAVNICISAPIVSSKAMSANSLDRICASFRAIMALGAARGHPWNHRS